MGIRNQVEFKVSGKYALFTDPITRVGGEKCTYLIPTYQALKGIIESIYWKPTLIWYIDEIRIMNPIRTSSKNVKPRVWEGGNSLSIYNYLEDVAYHVRAHFEWNTTRKDLEKDRNEHKHHNIARRMIERGGRRDIFLGTRECQGYVEPCLFDEGKGYFDELAEMSFGMMFHSFAYPDETGENELKARFWEPKMMNGIIRFIKPDECKVERFIKPMKAKIIATVGLDEPGLEEYFE